MMTPAELALALVALQSQLAAHAPQIYSRTGLNAYEYITRLDGDVRALRDPASAQLVQARAQLDRQLAQDLLDGKYRDVSGVRAAAAVWLHLPHGLPPESVGIYVPQKSANASQRAVVLFLHGAGEPETDIVASAHFQQLAETSNAIIVAPWAEGSRTFDDPAPEEIGAALDAVERAYTFDPRRVYVAGISMGAAGAFHLLTQTQVQFAGILGIIGDLNPRDLPHLGGPLRERPVYLVNGLRDPIMTPSVVNFTFSMLQSVDEYTSLYLAPNAGHSVREVLPQLDQAWSDMFAGTIRAPAQNAAALEALKSAPPPAQVKP